VQCAAAQLSLAYGGTQHEAGLVLVRERCDSIIETLSREVNMIKRGLVTVINFVVFGVWVAVIKK
jgi:hypothetical protein